MSEESKRRRSEEANARENELEVVIDFEGTVGRNKSESRGWKQLRVRRGGEPNTPPVVRHIRLSANEPHERLGSMIPAPGIDRTFRVDCSDKPADGTAHLIGEFD
jgi:hypothetical protein